MEVLLDGESLNEVQVYAQGLAAEGIPDLFTAIATVFRTSRVSREYRQLAKLLPAGHDSWARGAQRRLGSIVATPVMRSKERRWLAASP